MMSRAVVRPAGDAPPAVHIDPVGSLPSTLEPGASLLHLGSQDLIRFAGYATKRGFQASELLVADILREFGSTELEAAMRDDFDGYYVVGVTLISPDSGLRIDVRRSGFVSTSVVEEAERLIDSAWRELHLS